MFIYIGWSIVYIEGFQVMISLKIYCISLKIDFVFKLANSAGPDEMLHNKCSISSGFSLFAKVPVLGFTKSQLCLELLWQALSNI